MSLYGKIDEYITQKAQHAGWGKSTIEALAQYIKERQSNYKGFSARNLWRMKQFYEAYKNDSTLSAVLTEVVKYALNRHASSTLIAEYETKLIKKSILEKKLHEISQLLEWGNE